MAYSFQTFTLNQVLTAAQMNQVEVNIRDHRHNVSGVASIQEGDLAAAAVDQSSLKTTTASGTTSVPSTGTTVSLTGGTYSWWTGAGGAASGIDNFVVWGNGDAAAGILGLVNADVANDGESIDFYRDERYIQASPPYTHGPLFVFLMLDASGNIVNIEVAPDPPWAYHGPTNITPEVTIDGKPCRRVALYDGKTMLEVLKERTLLDAVLDGSEVPVEELREITLAYKDSDMNVVPHHWVYNRPEYFTGRTVVMLEPGTALMDKLYTILKESHAHDVRDLINASYLTFDNSPILLPTQPQGVQVIKATWRKV